MSAQLLIKLNQKQSRFICKKEELSSQIASKKQNEKITVIVMVVSTICIPLGGVTIFSLVGGVIFWLVNKKAMKKLFSEYNSILTEIENNNDEIINAQYLGN